ncbi:RNA polymerase sigma-70 factor [Pedobacter sp. ASV28]|uniref:RNA polymerase sigma-70 factor n=1 Tax=Pedobacter sp. ASV28 TaxID=2795123 RepID=UPI0018ED923C
MNFSNLSHQEILEHLLNGDENAFDQLFTHFYPGLLRYAKSLLPYPTDAAEDIVSDVFCSLWVNREKIVVRDSIASYLYRAVKNRIINSYKKSKLNVIDVADSVNEIVGKKHELPDQLMSFKEFNERISYLINRLPEKTRLVFLMSREEGLTYEQIAEVMEVSINTIKTHMFRAIRFLKEAFNANDYIHLLIIGIISALS